MRRVNFEAQERVDLPDMTALSALMLGEFRRHTRGLLGAGTNSIVKGFEVEAAAVPDSTVIVKLSDAGDLGFFVGSQDLGARVDYGQLAGGMTSRATWKVLRRSLSISQANRTRHTMSTSGTLRLTVLRTTVFSETRLRKRSSSRAAPRAFYRPTSFGHLVILSQTITRRSRKSSGAAPRSRRVTSTTLANLYSRATTTLVDLKLAYRR